MEFASLPAIMNTAQDLVKKIDTMTNFELASIISKDPFAIAKVLDLANRRGGSDKISVTKLEDAILSCGYGKVRAIARQLLDMEQMKERLRFQEQQEAAALALCSCSVAQSMAAIGTSLDPNRAYTAAVLRNYGKVLLSAFIIEPYRKALALTRLKKGEDPAFRDIFGITPVELTYDLLVESKLPKDYLKTLRRIKPELYEPDYQLSEAEEYMMLAEFASKLVQLVFDFKLKCSKFEDEYLEMASMYSKVCNLSEQELFSVLSDLDEDISRMSNQYDIDPLPAGLPEIINARAERTDPPPPPKRKDDPNIRASDDPSLKKKPEEILAEGLEEVGRVCTKRNTNFEEIYNTLLRTVKESLDLEECVVFRKGEKDGDPLTIFAGPGELYKLSKRMKLKLKGDGEDFVSVAIKTPCDGLIFDTGKPNVKKRMPGWFDGMKSTSVLLMPYYEKPEADGVFALILGFRTNGTTLALNAKVQNCLMQARKFVTGCYIGQKCDKEAVLTEKEFMDLKTFNQIMAKPPAAAPKRKLFPDDD